MLFNFFCCFAGILKCNHVRCDIEIAVETHCFLVVSDWDAATDLRHWWMVLFWTLICSLVRKLRWVLFYIFMLRRGVGSLLSGCRNSDRLYSPLLFLCGFLIGQKNRFAEELVFCFLSFFFFFVSDDYLQNNSETTDSRSNHKTAIINTIFTL